MTPTPEERPSTDGRSPADPAVEDASRESFSDHDAVETLESAKPEHTEMLVITGVSGAGRATAAHALEDNGWYVVDNLPPQMLGPLADLVARAPQSMPKLAVVIDVRGKALFQDFSEALDALHNAPVEYTVLFLDASDQTIIARYEAQRRPHPLQGGGRILDGIHAERALLKDLRTRADVVLDTTGWNVHELSRKMAETYAVHGVSTMNISVMSFGFKYGVPADANFMADIRFVPNPHWIPELRPQTGRDAPVRDFVLGNEGAQEFVDCYVAALRPVIEGYRRENKHYATFAIGCTGGKHRSVAVAEEIARRLREIPRVSVQIQHRDLGRE